MASIKLRTLKSPREDDYCNSDLLQHTIQGLVESFYPPTESLTPHVMVARSPSHINTTTNQVIVRLLNVNTSPVKLKTGSTIANLYLIDATAVDLTSPTDPRNHTDGQIIPEQGQPLIDGIPSSITAETKRKVTELLVNYQHIFSTGPNDMGLTDKMEHHVSIKPGTKPIRQPPYRVGPVIQQQIDDEIEELQKFDLIKESHSPWSAPVVLVSKPDNTKRLTVDYSKINSVSDIDVYPLPRIDDSLEALSGASYFSTFDLRSGFWQVPLSADAKDKVAFVTRSGHWTRKVMAMGLAGSPATFERLMERVMRGLQWKILLVYLDDIIVYSSTEKQQVENLEAVFQRLSEANLR
jgi:hypothetical protein